jgi:diaminopimelate decarboxylase
MSNVWGFNGFKCKGLEHLPTPCFIYNLDEIEKKIRQVKNAFGDVPYNQYYPIKTNPCVDVVRYCMENGLGIDACSMGDLEVADCLNVPSSKISFTGVALGEQDMRMLHGKKIIPNLSSLEDVKRWGRLFSGSQIGLRISTIEPGNHFDSQGGYSLKMGIYPCDWLSVRDVVKQYSLEIIKLHRHESQNSIAHQDLLDSYNTTFNRVPDWVWKTVKRINFGGGWGLPYLRYGRLDVGRLVRGIVETTNRIKERCASGHLEIEIEPGEFMVGECGFLFTKVIDVRCLDASVGGKTLQVVILDTPYPITSGFRAPELLAGVTFEKRNDGSQEDIVFTKIYGRSNTSMDTINKGAYLPGVTVGRYALIKWVGAYVPVLMSYFNEQDIPAEFVIKNEEAVKSRGALTFNSFYRETYLK